LPGTNNGSEVPIPELVEWDDLMKLSFEKEMIGFYVTGHPLTRYGDLIKKFSTASSSTLRAIPGSRQVRMAGLVKSVKEISARKGDRMAFMTLEDLEGLTEVTVFSDLYAQRRDVVQVGEPVIISGVREGDAENPKVLAQEICRIQDAPSHFCNRIHLRVLATGTDPAQITDLKGILASHRGKLPVTLHVVIPNRTETVISLPSVSCEASKELEDEVESRFGYQAVWFD
jgi:DNA polymerase-3 subunit alpha